MAESLPRKFGRYTLVERIAVGGMAEIFRAEVGTDSIHKTVVVKRVLPHFSTDPEFIAMFREESKVAMRLSHANIVQVFDHGSEAGQDFLAMEFVDGKNLRDVIKQVLKKGRQAVPISIALFIAAEAAKGLSHAHNRKDPAGDPMGIVHRDVSPPNLLLSWEGEVKITDFGIARAHARSVATRSGRIKGKVPYLAPEQLSGRKADPRVDVYALGCVVWELATGRRLVDGPSPAVMLEAIGNPQPWPLLSTSGVPVPEAIDRLVAKAIAKNPDERFATADAFAREAAKLVARLEVGAHDLASFLAGLYREEVSEPSTEMSIEGPVVGAIPSEPPSRSRSQKTGRTRQTPSTVESPMPQSTRVLPTPEEESETAISARGPALGEPSISDAAPLIRDVFDTPEEFVNGAWSRPHGRPGMFIAEELRFRSNTVVRVQIIFPDRRFTLMARVLARRRHESVDRGLRFPRGTLVEFLDGPHDDRAALFQFCRIV